MLSKMLITPAAALVLLLGASCAPSTQAPAPAPAAVGAATPAAPSPKYGGVFKMGTFDAPQNLHPLMATDLSSKSIVATLYDTLLNFDNTVEDFRADFPIIPWLAESWQLEGQNTYVFKLRKGVKFHDGVDVTVDDVIWSLEYTRDPKNPFEYASALKVVDKIEKVDSSTFKMVLKGAAPNFLIDIASHVTNSIVVLPKHIFDKGGAEALMTQGIGTGPFKLKKFDPTGKTVLVRNESWWGKDKLGKQQPYLDAIELTHNMDRSAQEAAFAAQELDIYQFASKPVLDAFLKYYKDVNIMTFYANHASGLYFNLRHKPFDDVRVRRSVHLALDRQEIMETMQQGVGLIGGPVVPGVKKGWGYSQEELLKLPGYRQPKDQDTAEARRLLTEAGYPGGFKANLIYIKTWTSTAPWLELAVPQIKKAGTDIELKPLDNATYLKELGAGNFDIAFVAASNPQPLLRLDQYFHSGSVWAKGAGINDPEMDKLVERLRVALDAKEQKDLVRRLQDLILDRVYYAPIGDGGAFNVTQKWVNDFSPNFSNQPQILMCYWSIWIDTDKLPAKRR